MPRIISTLIKMKMMCNNMVLLFLSYDRAWKVSFELLSMCVIMNRYTCLVSSFIIVVALSFV
jgi:hypothetical protein